MKRLKQWVLETKYYSRNGERFLRDFLIDTPYMNKYDVQKFQDEMIVNRYQNIYRNQLLKIRTSGSTGKIVEVLWDKDDYIASNLCLWRLRKRYYSINHSDFYLTFHSTVYNGTQVRDNKESEFIHHRTYLSINKFSFFKNNFEKYVEEISKQPIKWIFTQPSMLLILVKKLQDHNISPDMIFPELKYIELNGEILFKSDSELFKNFFKVPIANLYGASEVNGIAYQCPNGHLHIMDQNIVVQLFNYNILNNHIYEGEIAVSSLHNKAMPIVSYAIGDKVIVNTSVECEYSSSPEINIIIGRTNDKIYLSEKLSISSYQLSYWIERVNTEIGNPILEYKIKADTQNNVIFLYIKNDFKGWENVIVRKLKEQIGEVYSGDNIDCICLYNPIEISNNGKVRSVESDE